jgi:nicotinamidase-related amidase
VHPLDDPTVTVTDTVTVADTDPYPWPWNGVLDPAHLCLVVAGAQRVHAAASPAAHDVAEVIDAVAVAVRRAGGTVCHLRHTAPTSVGRGRRRPLLPELGEEGWAPVLRPSHDDLVVTATGHDGFCGSGLDLELRARGIELVVAVGMAAEVAVSCTVRSANDRGYECLTLSDAVAPLDPATGARELHSITMSGGIFGAVGTSDALLSALESLHQPAAVPS